MSKLGIMVNIPYYTLPSTFHSGVTFSVGNNGAFAEEKGSLGLGQSKRPGGLAGGVPEVFLGPERPPSRGWGDPTLWSRAVSS